MTTFRIPIVHNIYNNINSILNKRPPDSGTSRFGYELTYFGVILSFSVGVFSISGLLSYSFCSHCHYYFRKFREKMLTIPKLFAITTNS